METSSIKIEIDDALRTECERVKYERDLLLMLVLDEEEFGPDAFNRAVEKLQSKQER